MVVFGNIVSTSLSYNVGLNTLFIAFIIFLAIYVSQHSSFKRHPDSYEKPTTELQYIKSELENIKKEIGFIKYLVFLILSAMIVTFFKN